jgi:uncharacterized protein YbbC (DUF1343 family)
VRKAVDGKIQLSYLLEAYRLFPDKEHFFNQPANGKLTSYSFNRLAGNGELMAQIKAGMTEAQIRASWQPALETFKKTRKKYLLYAE